MAYERYVLLGFILISLACLLPLSAATAMPPGNSPCPDVIDYPSRGCFPDDFIFGAGSSAYQIEGAFNIDGKRNNSWDNFTNTCPDRTKDGSNGNVAADFYHLYKEDIQLMKNTNLDSFRLSISWARVIPKGKYLKGDGVNQLGVKFYNDLFDSLIAAGIKPFVVIFHWDIPQALEDYGGLLNSSFIDDYKDYAGFCFEKFGDRVKFWTTFNEPWTYSVIGYDLGRFPPGRCSWFCHPGGNSSTEPYKVTHNLLLAHAAAVHLYKTKYQPTQKGQIGMSNICNWAVPLIDNVTEQAAQRAIDFMCGWLLHPITYGDYPQTMKDNVGDRLPIFTTEQSALLKGSYDFFGINYYTGWYIYDALLPLTVGYITDAKVLFTFERINGTIGPPTASPFIYLYPEGMRKLLNYLKDNYNNPPIYITENGLPDPPLNITENGVPDISEQIPQQESLNDQWRITWLKEHLSMLSTIITDDKVDVRGYFAWSFMDAFEWTSGYTERFGLYFIDWKDLTRTAKASADYYAALLKK